MRPEDVMPYLESKVPQGRLCTPDDVGRAVAFLAGAPHPETAKRLIDFLASEISPNTCLNIMDQYRPEYHACEYVPINRRITHKEYLEATQLAKRFQLHRGF
jgi:uncharacterized Fe-S radical SAM superfamily protein PflX